MRSNYIYLNIKLQKYLVNFNYITIIIYKKIKIKKGTEYEKNKKILMIGTAITSIVAPVATIISCSFRNTNHNVNHSAIYNTPNSS